MSPLTRQRVRIVCDAASAVSIIVIIVVVTTQLFAAKSVGTPASALAPTMVAVGDRINVPTIHLERWDEALVLAIDVGCAWNASMVEFYRDIAKARGRSVPLIAVMPQSRDESRAYLESLDLPFDEVHEVQLKQAGITVWPALILLDGHGAVRASWPGVLTVDQKQDVIRQVGLGGILHTSNPGAKSVDVSQAAQIVRESGAALLDVRDREQFRRGHILTSVNIPVDELSIRAIHELRIESHIVVLCGHQNRQSSEATVNRCSIAGELLTRIGFEKVYILSSEVDKLDGMGLGAIVKTTEHQADSHESSAPGS